MRTIAKLFGRSPFVPLQAHMERVAACVEMMRPILNAFFQGDSDEVARLADAVSQSEHRADEVKQDIQHQLHRHLFMAVDRSRLLEIVTVQDSIADKVENLGSLLTLKAMTAPPAMRELFDRYLEKNIEAFEAVRRIVAELDELLESSFGGAEAQRVGQMVHGVAVLEHEADRIQHDLLRELFNHENDYSHGEFYLWTQILRQVGEVADLSERLAHRIRDTLELK